MTPTTPRDMDNEATAFALELLMPEDQFRAVISRIDGFDIMDDKQIKRVADRSPFFALVISLSMNGDSDLALEIVVVIFP